MRKLTSKIIIGMLVMMLVGSWVLLYFEAKKSTDYMVKLQLAERVLQESDEMIDKIYGAGSNIEKLTEDQYRLCQKTIPLLMQNDPKLLNQFNMDIRFRENDTNWIIEMYSRGLIGGGLEAYIDKTTEEVVAFRGTQ